MQRHVVHMLWWPKTQICDAPCGMSGNDAMPRDLMMVIFYWSAWEVRVRLLQSVKSFYWPSEDGAFALRSYMKLEEVIFLPVLKTSCWWATVDPVNALALRYRPVAGRARASVAYCDFSCFMFYSRFKSSHSCAGLASSGESLLVWVSYWVVVIYSGLVSSGLNLSASELGLD